MRPPIPLPLGLLLWACLLLAACDSLTVTGRIAVKGNEPLSYVALITQKGDFSIVGPFRNEIRARYQGMFLKVRARIVREARGPGSPAELEVIEILEIGTKPF
jgi:hypothetical protein